MIGGGSRRGPGVLQMQRIIRTRTHAELVGSLSPYQTSAKCLHFSMSLPKNVGTSNCLDKISSLPGDW